MKHTLNFKVIVFFVIVFLTSVFTSNFINTNVSAQKLLTITGVLTDRQYSNFSQNNILYYDPCSGGNFNTLRGGCSELARLRTAMWNGASEEDKKHFMNIVLRETGAAISGVEFWMNRALAVDGGDLHKFLADGGSCHKFGGGGASVVCTATNLVDGADPAVLEKLQNLIDMALGGSNITGLSTGNSSWSAGGDATTGGPVSCLWDPTIQNEYGGACKTDIDYSRSPFSDKNATTMCSHVIQAAGGNQSSGWECLACDGTWDWCKSLEATCGGAQSVGSGTATMDSDSSFTSGQVSSSIAWDDEGWITGGMDGYERHEAPDRGRVYDSGKPNKIMLHYTQGTPPSELTPASIYGQSRQGVAAHFSIDLPNKKVAQHYPIGIPSGACMENSMDVVQIEIIGFGFQKDNPDNPNENSLCIIDGDDWTNNDYCFAKFGTAEWDYLATLLAGISSWASQHGGNIPLTTSLTWTGDVNYLRLSKENFKKTTGIVAHMHGPNTQDHNDTGNIWPMVEAAINRVACNLNNNTNSISGAKNAEKQANEIDAMEFDDKDKNSMKLLLENFGDLAYRTGQAYNIPWIAILVQGRYEDPAAKCGNNNYWGIRCVNGSREGEGGKFGNIGKGFDAYGSFLVDNSRYKEALEKTDFNSDADTSYEFIKNIGLACWRVSDEGVCGYSDRQLAGMKNSIEKLTDYIKNDEEGKKIFASFGSAECYSEGTSGCSGDNGGFTPSGDVASLQNLVKKWAWPDYKGRDNRDAPMPAYGDFMKNASYTGGCNGQDCGAFVSNLIVESGWDPNYATGPTQTQYDYLEKSDKWEDITDKIHSNSDAKPGDVIIDRNEHVLIYVGKINGFDNVMASASQCHRWPEADYFDNIMKHLNDTSYNYHVFRKVK